jgi:hypothetical protein
MAEDWNRDSEENVAEEQPATAPPPEDTVSTDPPLGTLHEEITETPIPPLGTPHNPPADPEFSLST